MKADGKNYWRSFGGQWILFGNDGARMLSGVTITAHLSKTEKQELELRNFYEALAKRKQEDGEWLKGFIGSVLGTTVDLVETSEIPVASQVAGTINIIKEGVQGNYLAVGGTALALLPGVPNTKIINRTVYINYKSGVQYFGKSKYGVKYRYSKKHLDDNAKDLIEGIPDNDTALGVEQLILELNGGPQGKKGTKINANINNSTVKQYRKDMAENWLKTNYPNWKTDFKF